MTLLQAIMRRRGEVIDLHREIKTPVHRDSSRRPEANIGGRALLLDHLLRQRRRRVDPPLELRVEEILEWWSEASAAPEASRRMV